jgi:hypothetical protein
LGEGSGKKIGSKSGHVAIFAFADSSKCLELSVKELANLFGLDARGRVIKD